MSKSKHPKRKPWQNFWTERGLVKSKAFIKLTGKSAQVYFIFRTKLVMNKVRHKDGTEWVIANNGQIQFTYVEANSYGITDRQFTRAVDQLVEHGLVDITRQGSMGAPTQFSISDRWQEFGTEQFERRERLRDTRAHKLLAAEKARSRKSEKSRGGGDLKIPTGALVQGADW
ncbi:MAG TPA: hypothetical protein VM182_01375 [Terriglobia bacterium]|nr:hypothetical protein [Terriglobia bacterium]